MLRTALHNVLIMLGVALPVLLMSAMLFGWLAEGARGRSSLDELGGSFEFLYMIWAVPALAVATIHQLVLAILPYDWHARTTRLVILGTSLGIATCIAWYVGVASTRDRGRAVALALLPSAIAYGVLVQPLRTRRQE